MEACIIVILKLPSSNELLCAADMQSFLLVQKLATFRRSAIKLVISFNRKFSFLLVVFFFLLLVKVFKSVTDKNNISS